MFRRNRSHEPISRGQALVEFALLLPLLALLLVMAIDFGRVFFGWVSLTNAARIGANYAGYTPDLLTHAADRDEYEALIADHVTGCDLNPANMNDPAYDPVFTDANGDNTDGNHEWGDHVTVTISCELGLLTPLASIIVGSVVPMQAQAVFPIREGDFAGPGGGGSPPNPPCTLAFVPDLLNRTVAEARAKWVGDGFLLANFSVSPNIDVNLVKTQTFTPAASVHDCVDPTGFHVSLTSVAPPPCPSGQAQVPDLIGLLVSEAKTAWTAAGFSGAFKPSNAVDTKTVLSQFTTPTTSPPINGCVTVSATVTVTYGDPPPPPCDIPNMIGLTLAQARSAWSAAHFTTPLTYSGNARKPVVSQNPNHPGTVACTVTGKVHLQ
jgi:hypothetical protein